MKEKSKKDVKNVLTKQVNESKNVKPTQIVSNQDALVNTFGDKVLKDVETKAKSNFKDLNEELKVSLIMDAYFKQSQTDRDTLNVINHVLRYSKDEIQISQSSTKDDLDLAKKSYLSVVRSFAMYLTKDKHICRAFQVYSGVWKFEEINTPARLISLFVSETVHNIMIAHKPITIDTNKYYEKDDKGKFIETKKTIEEIEAQIAENKANKDAKRLESQLENAKQLVEENGFQIFENGKVLQSLENKDVINLITEWALYHPTQFAAIVSNVEKRTVKITEKRSKKDA